MMVAVSQDQKPTLSGRFLSEIKPMNGQRRDDALYLLACEYDKPLTPYDICKTQVLSDVFHVVQTGKAIFGGKLYAMPFGPVVKQTLDDCERWAMGRFLAAAFAAQYATGLQPLQPSGWTGVKNHIPEFEASSEYSRRDEASWEWFSADEEANVRRAYERVISMPWKQSQAYFHDPISAIGYAYDVATRPFEKPFKKRVEMNWFDVLDGAERFENANCSYARSMLNLWL